jgi:hypothetical protein
MSMSSISCKGDRKGPQRIRHADNGPASHFP